MILENVTDMTVSAAVNGQPFSVLGNRPTDRIDRIRRHVSMDSVLLVASSTLYKNIIAI